MTASAGVVWLATQTPPLRGFHCTLCVFMTAEIHKANTRKVTNDANSPTVLLSSLSGHTLKQKVQVTAHETWKWAHLYPLSLFCGRRVRRRNAGAVTQGHFVCNSNTKQRLSTTGRRWNWLNIWLQNKTTRLTPKKQMRIRRGNRNAYRIQNPINQIMVILQLINS